MAFFLRKFAIFPWNVALFRLSLRLVCAKTIPAIKLMTNKIITRRIFCRSQN